MNMPILTQYAQNQKTMSSREIAHLCEKEHFNVKRDCEVIEQCVHEILEAILED